MGNAYPGAAFGRYTYTPGSVKTTVSLACAADDRYAVQLAVVACSAAAHLGPEARLDLYVVDGGLTDAHRRKVDACVRQVRPDTTVRWLVPDLGELAGVKVDGHISIATYIRLLLPTLLPPELDRVIYLDGDLVVEGDLARLWDEDLSGVALRAVQDYSIPYVGHRIGLKRYQELGYPPDHPYLNGGVLLMNLDWWRRHEAASRVLDYLRTYRDDVRWWDQDGINAVLGRDWRPLDPRWNRMTKVHTLHTHEPSPFKEQMLASKEELLAHPYVVHFSSPSKPWTQGPRHPDFEDFRRHLHASGWFRTHAAAEVWLWRQYWPVQSPLVRRGRRLGDLARRAAGRALRLVRKQAPA